MTAQQETLFQCDRCANRAVVPLANTPAPTRGLVAPEGWTTIWINETTHAPVHLCPACGSKFENYMNQVSPLAAVP